MEYNFKEIEAKWQSRWRADKTYKVETDPSRPKFYVLDMFPYPSGAGLHVGHPLGYIASDIYSRYKRLKGFNVLHPMGYDAFGLPAEQYAIQTGQHPAVTTEQNIARYREQLDKIGFSFDWDREVRTCDPGYYKWTQWAFLEMFSHWYDRSKQQARPVAELVADVPERVYPVGRLDYNSEGLLLMTNDGVLANALMHPKKSIDKTYLVWVSGYIAGKEQSLSQPIEIDGRKTSPAAVQLLHEAGTTALFRVTIHEGRNRQIRRLCERAELTVTRLRRVQEGQLTLGDLKPGQHRPLTEAELRAIFEEIQK